MREETGLDTEVGRLLFEGQADDGNAEKCFLLEPLHAGQEARLGEDPDVSRTDPDVCQLVAVGWLPLEDMRDDCQVREVIKVIGRPGMGTSGGSVER
jgi:hypothetical protein